MPSPIMSFVTFVNPELRLEIISIIWSLLSFFKMLYTYSNKTKKENIGIAISNICPENFKNY